MTTVADVARGLNFRARRRDPAAAELPALFLMTDSRRLPDPAAAAARLPRGAAVIVRDYDRPDREALARRLMRVCRPRGIRVLIAGDGRLAARVGADGLHLPEGLARRGPPRWRLWRRPDGLVTAAAHSAMAARRAKAAGARAAVVSPVFATASHPDATGLGPLRLALIARRAGLPVVALGGIDPRTVRRLLPGPAAAVAGIGAVLC